VFVLERPGLTLTLRERESKRIPTQEEVNTRICVNCELFCCCTQEQNKTKQNKKHSMDPLYDNLPHFNLQEFRCITESDVGMEIDTIDAYLESSQQELSKLKDALSQSKAKEAEIAAHSLKGASKYVAATRVCVVSLFVFFSKFKNQINWILPLDSRS
jgi:hypothetical protein